jgi:mannose-6-phosphate isomerase-like protein (cupin superfamily)
VMCSVMLRACLARALTTIRTFPGPTLTRKKAPRRREPLSSLHRVGGRIGREDARPGDASFTWHGSVVSEANLRETRFGLAPDGEGWFVVNARDVRWRDFGPLGVACDFEGKRPFRQLGINLNRLLPGQPMTVYHRELHQEGFLIIAGECLLVVEGEEWSLKAWDLFHCPGGTAHAIVGAGYGPFPCSGVRCSRRPEGDRVPA